MLLKKILMDVDDYEDIRIALRTALRNLNEAGDSSGVCFAKDRIKRALRVLEDIDD